MVVFVKMMVLVAVEVGCTDDSISAGGDSG